MDPDKVTVLQRVTLALGNKFDPITSSRISPVYVALTSERSELRHDFAKQPKLVTSLYDIPRTSEYTLHALRIIRYECG